MKKIVFAAAILCSSISNAAFNAAKEQFGIASAVESIAAGVLFHVKKQRNKPVPRKESIRLMFDGHCLEPVSALIMEYDGDAWVMRFEKEMPKGSGIGLKSQVYYGKKYRVFHDGLGALTLEKLTVPFTQRRLQISNAPLHADGVPKRFVGSCVGVDFTPDGQKIAALNGPSTKLCNLEGQCVQSIQLPDECALYSMLEAVSNDNEFALASMEEKKEILIGKSVKQNGLEYRLDIMHRLPAHEDPLLGMSYLGNGKLRSCDRGGIVREYEKIFN